jgi:DNA polymerase-3 subunit chi
VWVTCRLLLHPLPGDKRAGQLAKLVEELYKERRRLVVWVADEGRLQILDDYLWSFRKLSFVPHAVWSPTLGELDEPVVLVSQPANPNRASVLVIGDEPPPAEWAASFDEVHDLIPGGEDGERRRRFWQEWGQTYQVKGGP